MFLKKIKRTIWYCVLMYVSCYSFIF